jgi:hypothetical protein
MSTNPQLEQLLGAVFDRFREGEDPAVFAKNREEFIFHMTDWLNDLEELTDLYRNPGKHKASKASTLVGGFLYHVIPHLKAAGRLLLDEIPDAFEPKAREKSKPAKRITPHIETEEETATR